MSEALLVVGKKIQSIRVTKNLSRNRVSTDLRLSTKYLYKIENGYLDEELEFNNVIRYLKLYLEYFNMNADMIISDYKYKSSNNSQKKKKRNVIKNELILPNKHHIGISIMILAILLMCFNYFEFSYSNYFLNSLSNDNKILLRN